jgi:hypothetical protein
MEKHTDFQRLKDEIMRGAAGKATGQLTDELKGCGLCFHGAFPPAARFQAERSPGFRHLQIIINYI